MKILLTIKEVGLILHVHPNTVYRLVKKGEIPYLKIKRVGIRFEKEKIEEWLNRRSSKIYPLLEPLLKADLALDSYDKLYLKGGKSRMSQKVWSYPFGSVYLRQTKSARGRWYIYYRIDGERVREVVRNAQSRADALKVLQVKVADAFKGKHGFKKEEKNIKFKDFAEEYIRNYAKANKRSWQTDEYMLKRLKTFFGDKALKEINSLMVEQFRTSLLEEELTRSTANRYVALLKKMFNLAIDWGYLKENHVKKVKLFSEKDNQKERILTEEEEQGLLKASSKYFKPIVITAIHTGMRKGEILSLKWSQVDLSSGIIKVENTKSGKPRFIPINQFLLKELLKLKDQNGASPYVFLNPRTHKPMKDIKKSFSGATKEAKIKDLRFHDLRHTFATRLIQKGADLITVKELLGHHSVRVTERYTHSCIEQKKRAVEALVSRGTSSAKRSMTPVPILSTKNKSVFSNASFTVS